MSDGIFVSTPPRHEPLRLACEAHIERQREYGSVDAAGLRCAFYAGAAAALAALRDHRTTEVSDEITAFAEERGRR